jgi:RimJ/RimL family protein N-acetyltransferase
VVRDGRAVQTGWDQVIAPAKTDEQKAFLLDFIAKRSRSDPRELIGPFRFEVLGVIRKGKIVGAVLLTTFRSGDAEIACVGDKGWLTRGDLRGLFRFCFEGLDLRRITSVVHRKHRVAREFNERVGFKMEGVKAAGMADGRDAILYGMTRNACRWI